MTTLHYTELLEAEMDVNKYKRDLTWEHGYSFQEAAYIIKQIQDDFTFEVPVDEEDLIYKLHASGHSVRKIAEHIGRSKSHVHRITQSFRK